MKTIIKSQLLAGALGLFVVVAYASAQDCIGQGGIAVQPGQGVAFSQVTFTYDTIAPPYEPSGTGRVHVDVSQLESLMSSGFLNVVTSTGWVTQNLPIVAGFYDSYGYQKIGTTLDLGIADGTTVTQIGALVCYTPSELSSAPTGPQSTFDVDSIEYNAQGECPGDIPDGYGGGYGSSDTSCAISAPPPRPVVGIVFPGGLFKVQVQPNHQNLEAANNQCAPAAFADNFTWLKTTYGIGVPQQNVIGLRGVPANSLVGQFDMTMWSGGKVAGREATERPHGMPVASFEQLRGYMQYVANNNLNLTLKHQGCSTNGGVKCTGNFNGTANFPFAGLTSNKQGGIVDPNFIYNEISAGAAVKAGFARPEEGGGMNADQDGGHAVSVIGAGSVLGLPFIVYLSDHVQTECANANLLPCPLNMLINDNKGTDETDFSFLVQNPGMTCPDRIPNGQPVALLGFQNCDSVTNVMTQKP